MTLPVRDTVTHWTTGSRPVTFHAIRVNPVAPVSVYAVAEESARISTVPGRFKRAVA